MISRTKYRHFWHGNQGYPYEGRKELQDFG